MSTPPPDADAALEGRPRVRITDPVVMRALAHPARLAILDHLRTEEAATATECAEVCGLSPSATSYHLRALAKVGLVEQAPGRGDGRERLWRSTVKGGLMVGSEDGIQSPDPEARAAERELIDAFMLREDARARRWLARSEQVPPEWNRVSILSDVTLQLTAEELGELTEQMLAMVSRYRKPRQGPVPPGSRTVSMLLRAFPTDDFRAEGD